MIQCVHQRFAETFFRMLSGIERISAEEIPSVSIAAPDHSFVPFPAVAAKPFKVFFHKPFHFVPVLKHRRKLLQQLCLTILAFALDLFKPLLELLQFLTLFGIFSPPFLPVRAFRMRYRYPMAPVVVNLCREKVHLSPPRIRSDPRVSAILFVLFSCKFLSSDKKFARKKGHSTKERITLVSFFYVMPLKITTPPRLFRSGLRRGFFSARFNLLGIASRLLCSYLAYSIKS